MKFSEMTYTRPDIDALLADCKALAAKAAAAPDGDALVAVYYEQSRAFADYTTASQLANIHYTCDTRDAYWKAEQDFFDANGPAVANAQVEISRAFLSNPHVDALTKHFGTTCVAGMKNAVLGMDDRTVDLQKEFNALVSQYQQVYGGALVELDGKQLTIPQLGPYKEDLDPAVRRAAYEAEAGYFDAHRAELDELYGTIRKYQPDAMIINNTGIGNEGRLVHREIDSVTFEQGLPTPIDRTGMEKYVAAEMCYTLNGHWGAAAADYRYKSPAELIEALCHCRKVGANLLLNIGPNADGSIPAMQRAILEILGDWMNDYGEMVCTGRPAGITGADRDFGLRTADGKTYLFVFGLPVCGDAQVTVGGGGSRLATFSGIFDRVRAVRWVDNGQPLPFIQDPDSGMFTFHAVGYEYGIDRVVRVAELDA